MDKKITKKWKYESPDFQVFEFSTEDVLTGSSDYTPWVPVESQEYNG